MDEKIQHFISLTGATIQVAQNMLEACAGDLDMAVSMHLDSGTEGISERVVHDKPDKSGFDDAGLDSETRTYEEMHGVRAPIPRTQGVLIEQEATRRTFRRRNIPTSIFDPFQDYSSTSNPNLGESDSKKKSLSELFKPPLDIMFQGDFQEARIAGQKWKSWLLVNLQDSSEFLCQTLNRDLWSNTKVKKIIKDNFVFLQIQRITDEGIKFRQLYQVESYPAIIIIDPRTGEKLEHWRHVTVEDFLSKVREFHSVNKLNEANSCNSVSTICDKSEDAQLEAAIQASLQETELVRNKQDLINIDSDSDYLLSPEENDSDIENSDMVMDTEGSSNSYDYTHISQIKTHTQDSCISKRTMETTHSDSNTDRSRKRPGNGLWNVADETDCPMKSKQPRLETSFFPNSIQTYKHSWSTDSAKLTKKSSEQAAIDYSSSTSEATAITDICSNSDHHPAVVELCQIMIRFPDGRRSLKSFPANNSIQELFDDLKLEGIGLNEYEITTTFPHKIVSALPHNTSFKHAGLYPRQTVYIQWTE